MPFASAVITAIGGVGTTVSALLAGADAGRAYLNINRTAFPQCPNRPPFCQRWNSLPVSFVYMTVQATLDFRRRLLDLIPRLRRYARALTLDASAADDLSQQTLERALLHWQQFDPRREMGVWLMSIAHNAHLDTVRRESRMTVTDPEEIRNVQDLRGAEPVIDAGLRLDLQAALARLPVDQREPLLLVCVEQLSYLEVAEVLHIPVGTVMSRVCRGRAALRKFLDGQGQQGASAGVQLKRVV